MAKIFYVIENAPDYAQCNFFKTEKEALEYGISQLPQFDMFDEPMNDEEADGEEWYTGDSLTFKKGILFSQEEGEVYIQPMDEDEAREYCNDENGAAIFFDGFSRGMYGYLGNGADGKGFKWDWDGDDINESNKTTKHVNLFEDFLDQLAAKQNMSREEYSAYYLSESRKSESLAKEIDKAMIKIDDSMSYTDFALAVGTILRDEYGQHTFEGFMKVLNNDLGLK